MKDIIKDLIEKLEAERKQLYISSKTIKCRIINPDKFQADIVKRNNKISVEYFLNIGEAKCEKSVTDFIRDQNWQQMIIWQPHLLPL